MNKLEKDGRQADFILRTEESHGFLMGNYSRDKDAAGAAAWLAELAAQLKPKNRTLIHYLDEIYARYGYCHNYLTEIRLLGAKGIDQIAQIMADLRKRPVSGLDGFTIREKIDRWEGEPDPHLSATDTSSRNVLIFHVDNLPETQSIRMTVRPSGTEPKFKIYFEIVGKPFDIEDITAEKEKIIAIREKLEKAFMQYCYRILGVVFPERGFLLFWQLPLFDKLKYFEIEEKIAALAPLKDADEKRSRLSELLSFLGANPVQKVDRAFAKKYGKGIMAYLDLEQE
jgi:phosphoglucomutase/phosphomannomutase